MPTGEWALDIAGTSNELANQLAHHVTDRRNGFFANLVSQICFAFGDMSFDLRFSLQSKGSKCQQAFVELSGLGDNLIGSLFGGPAFTTHAATDSGTSFSDSPLP